MKMKITSRNKIIGCAFVKWHGQYIALDLYEGNMVRYPDGNIGAIKEDLYKKYVKQYEDQVRNNKPISTAHEANAKMGVKFNFMVPDTSVDPLAAEKELYMRRHPEEFRDPSETVVVPDKKGLFGFFGKKKKEKESLICPNCGAANDVGKKFCGECGTALEERKEPIPEGPIDWTEKLKNEPPVETPESVHKIVHKIEQKNEEEKPDETHAPNAVSEPVLETKKEEFDVEVEDAVELDEAEEARSVKSPVQTTEEEPETASEPDTTVARQVPVSKAAPDVKKKPEKQKKPKKQKTAPESEDGGAPKKKSKLPLMIVLFLAVILIIAAAAIALLFSGRHTDTTTTPAPSAETSDQQEPYMAIMFTKDLDVDSVIEKSDLDGCILNEDQYEKYTNISTYIDENGEEVTPELISWDDVDSVIGKRVTSDVKKGALVYDTTITSQHVIAQKTYVDATVNGEDGTYEVENGVLPGNTKIQIVAVISTDGADQVQVLLSEMTLKDRSLESIFNSAGQDVLEKLAGGDVKEDGSSEGDGAAADDNTEESPEDAEE